MSYTKLDLRYTTDGINTQASVNTRQGEKHRTIALPKKVQEYGDRYGYESLEITFELDHLIIKYDGTVLMDMDINGTNNNEYIKSIVSYEWLPKQEVLVSTPVEAEEVEEIKDDVEEDTNDDDDFADDDEEWGDCEDVDYNDINYSIAEWEDGDIDVDACMLLDESMKEIVIPEEITSQETGKTHKVTTYSISDGEYKRLSLPKTIKNISGSAFSELPNVGTLVLELNSPHIKMENKVIYSHRTENGKNIVELQNTQLNKPTGKFIVPNGVTSIGKEAFVGCNKLEEIELPNTLGSVFSIDWISGCDKLQRISIHNTKGAISIFNDEDELNEVECTLEETLPSNIQVVYLDDALTEKQESQTISISKLLVGLCAYGFIGMFVMEASVLVWVYGLILFWTSFGKKSFEWQEKMWKWYMRKVATLFKENKSDKRIKLAVRLSADIFIFLFLFEAWWICALYGILMFWCEFGKRNLKCVKRITEWYIRRVKATLKQDDTVVLFSEELFTKELEE
ncbi:MAG: leucine-rich repeat protein [Paludibacteraceae bacterium]|nr:leucine-rich repeat protein [Paludibacteraceae bacterium]